MRSPPGLDPAPRDVWALEPGRFLNHGSFGACPRDVLALQAELRAEMEGQPVRYFVRRLMPRIDDARQAVAAFVDADPAGFAFVRNASEGVNAVLRSLRFEPGAEILVTDHGYGACTHAARYVIERAGGRLVTAALPFPGATPDGIVQAIVSAVTPRTRLALVDHITSPTALVLPIARIVAALAEKGVDTLVDGAHGPGMLPVSVREIDAAYYVANLHKWCCAPKGAGFLAVRADRRTGLHPAIISHGHRFPLEYAAGRSRFHLEFDWTGTADVSPWLCAPRAIAQVGALHPDGWPGWYARNRALALWGRDRLADALGVAAPCTDDLIGHMAALPLPPAKHGPPSSPLYTSPLQAVLETQHHVEVPIVPWPRHPQRLVRVSVAPYTTADELKALARALPPLLAAEGR